MAPGTDLLPLAEGGKLLGGDKNTEFEDGLQLGGKPFGLKVLELGLGLPDERHIQAQAEHAGGRGGAQLPPATTPPREQVLAARRTGKICRGAQLSLAAQAPPFCLIEKSPPTLK